MSSRIAAITILFAHACHAQFTIQTVAGGGPPDGTSATSVNLQQPAGIAIGPSGQTYIIAGARIFRLDTNARISSFAGSGSFGDSGDGGPAIKAQMLQPWNLAADNSGNLYIADRLSHRVRKVNAAGVITTIAGNGTPGSQPPLLSDPAGIAVDALGAVYIADAGLHRVLRLSPNGTLSTVAGTGTTQGELGDGGSALAAVLGAPSAVAVDNQGNIFIADSFNHRIRRVSAAGVITTVAGTGVRGGSGDGGPATAAQLNWPQGVCVDSDGNLFLADTSNRIRKVNPSGIISTVAGNGDFGFAGDGGPATSAKLWNPIGIALGSGGTLLIADSGNGRIRQVSASGIISTIAGSGVEGPNGDGGPAVAAQISPTSLTFDAAGNLVFSDNPGKIRRVNAAGVVSTISGSGGSGFSGDGGPATAAVFSNLGAVLADSSGNIYIADTNGNYRIRKINSSGTIQTVAGNGTSGSSGDGGPAINAQIGPFAGGMVIDGAGNLLFTDSFPPNSRIRRLTPAGIITSIAGGGDGYSGDGGLGINAMFRTPWDLAMDAAGSLYVADSGNHRIRKISPNGIVSTVAGNGSQGFSGDGGLAISATLNGPLGVAVDSAGNIYISDTWNHRIRRVTPSGIISTVAGDGNANFGGDGGPAVSAQLNKPVDLAFDSTGKLYVADVDNGRIRVLVPRALFVEPAVLTFTSQMGGPVPAAQNLIAVVTAGSTSVTATVTAGAWLRVSAISASSPPAFSATVDPANLGAGTYPGNIRFTAGENSFDVPVTLQINACSYTVTPASFNSIPSSGGTSNLSVATSASSCGWTAVTNAPWITITSGLTGTGNGIVSYQVAANTGVAARSGSITVGNQSIEVTQTGGLYFVPVVPCRIADTRNANGPFGGPRMIASEARSFAIPSSGCGIPSTAVAYSLNVTVVPAGSLGFLTLWPSGQARPLASTLNSFDGRIKANAAIVPAGSGGAVSVFVTDATDVILDINGYFVPGATGGLRFYSVIPCRIADTRLAAGTFGGPILAAGQSRSFPIPQSGCGVPDTAQAYSLNVTSVPTGPLGFLTAWPAGSARPLVSTLNAPTGAVTPNAAIVPAGTNKAISIFVTDSSHVVLDINGYFAASAPGGSQPLVFYTLEPCRFLDTRETAVVAAGETRTVPTQTRCGIPIAPVAEVISLNATAIPRGPLSYLTLWATFGAQPFVSTLNSFDGSVVANAAIVPASIGVNVFVTNASDVILDVNGWFGREFVP
jgi:sugar lactone lactonase YvrE